MYPNDENNGTTAAVSVKGTMTAIQDIFARFSGSAVEAVRVVVAAGLPWA